MLRLLLIFQIFYSVYQDHFTFETGLPGLNLPNLLFLATLFLITTGRKDTEPAPPARLRRALILFFATLIIGFVIAQIRAPGDLMADVTYLKNAIFSPLLYFLYLRCRQDFKTTRLMIIVVAAVASIAALQAVRQGLDYGIGNYNETHRATGPFGSNVGNANRAGVYFAMFLPMFIAITLFFRQLWWRLGALFNVGLLAFALLVTYSRQSYFIALLGLTVLLLRRNIVFAVVIGFVLVSLAGYLPDSVTQRVTETQQIGKTGEEEVDESTASRWEIWAGAMEIWRANPMGVGLNRFKDEIGNYSRYKHYDAHNFYVLTLTELGPQGLFALLMLLRALFSLGTFMRKTAPPDDPEARALALGFSVATLDVAAGCLYGSPFLYGAMMSNYWILSGLLERYFRLLRARADGATAQASKPAPPKLASRYPLAARTLPGRRE
ncbi:O-antigen ligase family protein [Rudaea sp.]|uniref:O-antigen ligase family protein n=1 Tax=Rudaea sp. TaxID=2136325 RepID=UPI00321FD857